VIFYLFKVCILSPNRRPNLNKHDIESYSCYISDTLLKQLMTSQYQL